MIWIIIIFYVVPTFFTWLYLHIAFSTKGQWCNQNPGGLELFFTFMPCINILFCLAWFFDPPNGTTVSLQKFAHKFFNIK